MSKLFNTIVLIFNNVVLIFSNVVLIKSITFSKKDSFLRNGALFYQTSLLTEVSCFYDKLALVPSSDWRDAPFLFNRLAYDWLLSWVRYFARRVAEE